MKKNKIHVQGFDIKWVEIEEQDYISLTDIIKKFGDDNILYNWIRNRNTIEFLGTWETLYNKDFKPVEFDRFRMNAGLNSFSMSPKKWIEATGAIGLLSKAGRYGGTYAHKDIAFEFCSWVSPVFKLYLIKEFQRLKEDENRGLELEWNVKRTLAKVNYRIHTDAIKTNLIPKKLEGRKVGLVYATEADMLNLALFGMTAKQWRIDSPNVKGNMRDFASTEQLLVLANLENLNAEFIRIGLDREERLDRLNEIAIHQMQLLTKFDLMKKLKGK